jgi:uncharacterized membrane protein YbhN (UPF0104 family)
MPGKLRRWWPAVKAIVCLAILAAIARRFAIDLARPELWQRAVHPGWLALSGLLYLLGIGLSALYWRRLLGHLGTAPPLGRALRAYYLGHLGKYLPGKAWALWLRAEYVQGGGVGRALAALTAFYEVLTTMASGALVAAVLFALLGTAGPGPGGADLRRLLRLEWPEAGVLGRDLAVLLALALLAATGLPLLPPLFNRVVHRLSLPFRNPDTPVPRIRLAHLAEGLALTALGWLLLGAALAAAVCGVLGAGLAWGGTSLARMPAVMSLAYVAGFVILVAPGGLGVREFFLTLLLAPELAALADLDRPTARGSAVLTVLVLRLVWTTAELLLAALVVRRWWAPPRPAGEPGADAPGGEGRCAC